MDQQNKNLSPEEMKKLQREQCIFCQIIDNKVPAKKVYSDEIVTAVLDINPLNLGHTLLLPNEHFFVMPQTPQKIIGHMFKVAKKLSNAILKGLSATGTTVFVANGEAAGQRQPGHLMIHIIPRFDNDDAKINLPEKEFNEEDLKKAQEAILTTIKSMMNAQEKPKKEPEKKKAEEVNLDDISEIL